MVEKDNSLNHNDHFYFLNNKEPTKLKKNKTKENNSKVKNSKVNNY
jgi:hypothetical protein